MTWIANTSAYLRGTQTPSHFFIVVSATSITFMSKLTPKSGFRRNWGAFEATYLLAKFSTLFIIAFMDPYNCLFRSLNYDTVAIVRQAVLLISTLLFFVNQCLLHPFLDPINNASEWTSRLNYVSTSLIALLVVLLPSEESIWDGPVLYTWVFSFYFFYPV